MAETPRQRFLASMMAAADLPIGLIDQPGTTVAGRADRADSGLALCYRVGEHVVIWLDPELENGFADLAADDVAINPAGFARRAAGLAMTHWADAQMKVLSVSGLDRPPVPAGYRHERLGPDDLDRVRVLTERCHPDDLEQAGLDELDGFDERAINVLTPPDDESPIAYASASTWDWDTGFADIGVLVHPDHRQRGLGTWVVAATVADLLVAGLVPLYRHDLANGGSDALSASLGFEPILRLQAYRASPPGEDAIQEAEDRETP